MFGSSEEDDVDCLFYIYARFLTDKQEGMLLYYSMSHKLLSCDMWRVFQELSVSHLRRTNCLEFTVD